MKAKCVNSVSCCRNFLIKVHLKIGLKFCGLLSDNSIEERTTFLQIFNKLTKNREHNDYLPAYTRNFARH